MKIVTLVSLLVMGTLGGCSGGEEIQIGSFKAKTVSVKQVQSSILDAYTEPSKRMSDELLIAAKSGNERFVRDLLSSSEPTPDDFPIFLGTEAKDEHGWTPLMWAVHYNHAAIVDQLLDHNANADTRADDGATPLALAIRNNNEKILRLLLDHCDSVDTPGQDGSTALMLAVAMNNLEFVEMLMRKGASPDLRDLKGRSAVQIASDLGNRKAVELLLEDVQQESDASH